MSMTKRLRLAAEAQVVPRQIGVNQARACGSPSTSFVADSLSITEAGCVLRGLALEAATFGRRLTSSFFAALRSVFDHERDPAIISISIFTVPRDSHRIFGSGTQLL